MNFIKAIFGLIKEIFGFWPLFLTMIGFGVFVASLAMFCRAKIKNKRNPGAYTDKQMLGRKALLIVSGIITVVFLGSIAGFMGLIFMLSKNM